MNINDVQVGQDVIWNYFVNTGWGITQRIQAHVVAKTAKRVQVEVYLRRTHRGGFLPVIDVNMPVKRWVKPESIEAA